MKITILFIISFILIGCDIRYNTKINTDEPNINQISTVNVGDVIYRHEKMAGYDKDGAMLYNSKAVDLTFMGIKNNEIIVQYCEYYKDIGPYDRYHRVEHMPWLVNRDSIKTLKYDMNGMIKHEIIETIEFRIKMLNAVTMKTTRIK